MFEDVWQRIVHRAGQGFQTKSGRPFIYRMSGNGVTVSRTSFRLAKSDFERAFAMLPLAGPGVINRLVRGPAYIWAILADGRIIGER